MEISRQFFIFIMTSESCQEIGYIYSLKQTFIKEIDLLNCAYVNKIFFQYTYFFLRVQSLYNFYRNVLTRNVCYTHLRIFYLCLNMSQREMMHKYKSLNIFSSYFNKKPFCIIQCVPESVIRNLIFTRWRSVS